MKRSTKRSQTRRRLSLLVITSRTCKKGLRWDAALRLILVLSLFPAALPAKAPVPGEQESRPARPPPPLETKIDFRRDIGPLLEGKCYFCHGERMQQGGLRLDNRSDALRGGHTGPVIRPGDSAGSRLIHLVAGEDDRLSMPFGGERLTTAQVALLRAWIDQGAQWPEAAEAPAADQPGQHWAFLPPRRPPLPRVEGTEWVRNPIDAFVLARLQEKSIQPSPEADRSTLIRRLSLDLIGLPPTPQAVERFLGDRRPDAVERLVDQLLSSPRYGEKWARQWLDLAHYADSDGYADDHPRPHAWRWRHWVIEALNRNMPFDQFTTEQIAGDLLPGATLEQKVATGFHRNTLTNTEGGTRREEFRVEQVVDRTSTVGTVWLGLTVGCARCHDHKYDPVTQENFYKLFAFFNTAVEVNLEAPLSGEMGPYLSRNREYRQKREALLAEYGVPELQPEWERKTLDAATNPEASFEWRLSWDILGLHLANGQEYLRLDPQRRTRKQQDKLTDHFVRRYNLVVTEERIKELKFEELWGGKLEELAEQYPALSEAQTIAQSPDPPRTHLLIRGDYLRPAAEVQPGVPAVLPPLPEGDEPPRLRLARWLVSRENPLTARVTVNRIWQELFGRGLVATSDDFGTRGDDPTHPELLDWLATEFVSSGWNVKKLQKLIVTSATYRQSSKQREQLQDADPENRWLARQTPLRLSAELIRDISLAAAGLLDPAIGGKSIRPPMPEGGYTKGKWRESSGREAYRRGLYIFFKRRSPYPQLMNFDAPDARGVCSRRHRSTTPLQALNLLNDPVFVEAARGLAVSVLRAQPRGSFRERLDYAFVTCLSRRPSLNEQERLAGYYRQQQEILKGKPESIEQLFPAAGLEGVGGVEAAAWVGLSSVLMNLDEFITRR